MGRWVRRGLGVKKISSISFAIGLEDAMIQSEVMHSLEASCRAPGYRFPQLELKSRERLYGTDSLKNVPNLVCIRYQTNKEEPISQTLELCDANISVFHSYATVLWVTGIWSFAAWEKLEEIHESQ
jgi:hypothetical protein